MTRPLRIEFPGALYHVTSRGDRREPIFADDADRQALLGIVGRAMHRYDARMLAYCLMGNHYHFVLCTAQANLSLLMRYINGVYTQAFNRRHEKSGHLFQGRFNAILVDKDAYLFTVCRYVEINPVRAGLVASTGDWPWSSFRAHVGAAPAPRWLDTEGLQGYLLGRPASTDADRRHAAERYAALAATSTPEPLWKSGLRQQIYLGDVQFVERMQALAAPERITSPESPRAQRCSPSSLQHWLDACTSRQEALYRAHVEGGMRMAAIAKELGLSPSTVSRLIASMEGGKARLDPLLKGKT